VNPTSRTYVNDELHCEAEKILAARGKPAGSYSAEDYVEAVEAARPSQVLRDAMLRLGEPYPEDETVSEFLLRQRQQEILRERHGFPFDPGKPLSHDELVDAMVQSIHEIGKPGEKRKDLADVQKASRDAAIVRAVQDGRILASGAQAFRDLWDANPTLAADLLAQAEPRPEYTRLVGKSQVAPDPEGFEEHVAAETILRAAGLAENYDASQYVTALAQVQRASEARPDTGPAVLASEIVTGTRRRLEREGYHSPTPGQFFFNADYAVSAIVHEAEEKAQG